MASNYPDILGEISSGARANISVLQLATALRPRIARAGRPFEMLMLLQNASDVELDVTVTLRLPDKDKAGKKKRFVTKAQRLVIGLPEAGVGLVNLPVSTLPDTAVGDDYKIGMEVEVKPSKKVKPNRIRLPEGGGEVDFSLLDEERRALIADLQKLHWTASQGSFRGNVIESTCTIMSGKVGAFADLEPSWVSLWTLVDHTDARVMFERHQPMIEKQLLPVLEQRRRIFAPIQEATQARFSDVGYDVTPLEINFIARLLTLILEYAAINQRDPRYLVGSDLNLKRYVAEGYLENPNNPIHLPFWMQGFLRSLSVNPNIAQTPVRAIAQLNYDDLLKDAMLHIFMRLETALDIDVGTQEERIAYIDNFMTTLEDKALDFNTLYVPLVLGGLVVGDSILLKDERPEEVVALMRQLLDARHSEHDENTAETFAMANRLLEIANNRYSGRNWN